MGHNGGFNPYRDQNGEYATPEGAGKPGRNRKRGGASAGKAAPSPRDSIIGGWPVGSRSQAYGTRSRANQVGSVPTPGYRPKGGGILGRSKLPNLPRSAPKLPTMWDPSRTTGSFGTGSQAGKVGSVANPRYRGKDGKITGPSKG